MPLGIANEPLLSDDMIVKLYGKDKNLDTILDEFKNEPLENRLLKAPLLLYLTQAPEAFIFEESGFGVITSDLEGEVGSLYRTNSRKKNYRVTRVNKEVFYDFLLGSL